MIKYSIIGKSMKVNYKGGMQCIFMKNICAHIADAVRFTYDEKKSTYAFYNL